MKHAVEKLQQYIEDVQDSYTIMFDEIKSICKISKTADEAETRTQRAVLQESPLDSGEDLYEDLISSCKTHYYKHLESVLDYELCAKYGHEGTQAPRTDGL